MSEEILGIMGNLEGKGKGGVMRKYALVFTPNELLVVKTGGSIGFVVSTIIGEAVDHSLGLSTITDVYNRIISDRAEELQEAKIIDVLGADKLNFSIPCPEIENIEVKKGGIFSPRGRMIITVTTKNKKYWFRITEEKAFNDYRNLAKKILPNIVK